MTGEKQQSIYFTFEKAKKVQILLPKSNLLSLSFLSFATSFPQPLTPSRVYLFFFSVKATETAKGQHECRGKKPNLFQWKCPLRSGKAEASPTASLQASDLRLKAFNGAPTTCGDTAPITVNRLLTRFSKQIFNLWSVITNEDLWFLFCK